tara:strand:- start:56 stop:457 length:402 start_codon:yes stop_codon:yes gene_type:complete
MNENKSNIKINIGTEKNFGIVFSLFFICIGLYPILFSNKINIIFCLISFIFLLFSIFYAKIFYYPNIIWFKFGILIGNILSPLIMMLIYFGTVTPTGLIINLIGKDLLKEKINNKKTYWIKKVKYNSTMKNQF